MEDVFESILKSFKDMKLWIPEIDQRLREISVNYGAVIPDWEKNREYITYVRDIWIDIKTWKNEDPKRKLEKYLKQKRKNTLSYCESMVVEDFIRVIEQDQTKDVRVRSGSP